MAECGAPMETPTLTVHGWQHLMSADCRVHLHLFSDVASGLITTGLVEFRADNGRVWGSTFEVQPVA